MNYVDVMKVFSAMGFGAVLNASDGTILDMNDMAKEFLSLTDVPKGEKMRISFPFRKAIQTSPRYGALLSGGICCAARRRRL